MKSIQRSLGLRQAMLGICLAACLPAAEAALTISNTRVIHSSDARNSSVVVANPSTKVFAAQTWVNTQEDDTDTPVPLIATPGLFRLDPGMEQLVQIQNVPNDLPTDRESLFYFNLQEIPQVEDQGENMLNIAMRTRIKVFHRPSQLQGRPEDHAKHLQWSLRKIEGVPHLVVNNPSPYHYTFSRLELTNGEQTEKVRSMAMAVPFGEQIYRLNSNPLQAKLQLTFSTINDYGVASAATTTALQLEE
ncbi:molecular chaperone [Pseudomonas sp. NBRC 111124]|uniref:fimbrial biogenesis chaperone n=1 Tax=Pseudomonas sp. NBRC 111124 TaxID=1661039 RepID=UPI0009E74CC3|nr:molecular chaperone [Pseudomonas sp. NBRC 111124]